MCELNYSCLSEIGPRDAEQLHQILSFVPHNDNTVYFQGLDIAPTLQPSALIIEFSFLDDDHAAPRPACGDLAGDLAADCCHPGLQPRMQIETH